jgi:hypothetical protein
MQSVPRRSPRASGRVVAGTARPLTANRAHRAFWEGDVTRTSAGEPRPEPSTDGLLEELQRRRDELQALAASIEERMAALNTERRQAGRSDTTGWKIGHQLPTCPSLRGRDRAARGRRGRARRADVTYVLYIVDGAQIHAGASLLYQGRRLRRGVDGAPSGGANGTATWPDPSRLRPVHRHAVGGWELPNGPDSTTVALATRQKQRRGRRAPRRPLGTTTSCARRASLDACSAGGGGVCSGPTRALENRPRQKQARSAEMPACARMQAWPLRPLCFSARIAAFGDPYAMRAGKA